MRSTILIRSVFKLNIQKSLTQSVSTGKRRGCREVSEVLHPPPNAKVEGVVRMLYLPCKEKKVTSGYSGLSYFIGLWPQDMGRIQRTQALPLPTPIIVGSGAEGLCIHYGYFVCVVLLFINIINI